MAKTLFLFSALLLIALSAQHVSAQTQLECTKSTGCRCETANFTIDFSGVFKKPMNFSDENGKYYYILSPCKPVACGEEDSVPTAALCQYDIKQEVSSNCGKVEENQWIISTEDSFTVMYTGGDQADKGRERQAEIQFAIDREREVSEITYNTEKNTNNAIVYTFEGTLTYKDAHHESKSGGGSTAGIIGLVLIFIVIIAVVAYFVIGMIVMYAAKGARGAEMIPNYDFWKGLPGLLKDGLCFTITPCKYCYEKRHGSYKSIQ